MQSQSGWIFINNSRPFSGGLISIILDTNTNSFFAGQEINGTVHVDQVTAFSAKSLTVSLIGKEVVLFHKHTGFSTNRKTEYYKSEEIVGKISFELLDLTQLSF